MTSDQTPNSDPNTTPQENVSPDPKTVEAKVVESSTERPKQTTAPKPAPKSDDSMEKVKAVAAELWRQAKPVLQTVGTQALLLGNRGTDFLLDKAFPTAKEKFLQILPADIKTQAQEKIAPVQEKVVPLWQKVWPWIKKTVGPLWTKAITFIRSKLPQDLSNQLSDRFLNILLVTSIYLVWSFFSGLTHPSQAKQPESDLSFPEVKNKPSMTAPERPKPQPPTVPKVSTPKVEPKPAIKPVEPKASKPVPPKITPAPNLEPAKPAPPRPTQPPETIQKPASEGIQKPATSEKNPEPITTKPEPIQPKPAPAKPIQPTPPVTPVAPIKPIEKGPDLVALKEDLVDSVDRVVEDATAMIGKVGVKDQQVNIQLSDRWYQLSPEEQSKLTQNLFSKSKKLDYVKLDVRDAKGEQVARSPYIGDDMIILKRSANITKAPDADRSAPLKTAEPVSPQTSSISKSSLSEPSQP